MNKLILIPPANAIAKLLCKFNDDDFHLIRPIDFNCLVGEFNNAVEYLENLNYIEVEGNNFAATFYNEGEVPQSSTAFEFRVRMIDKNLCKEI